MVFVIVLPSTNHNFDDFAPASRNEKRIFCCHTVRNGTDLRRSPPLCTHSDADNLYKSKFDGLGCTISV